LKNQRWEERKMARKVEKGRPVAFHEFLSAKVKS